MTLLREIPKDLNPKEIYQLFSEKMVDFIHKIDNYEDDPLFTRIRDTISEMDAEKLNVDSECVYKYAIRQHKDLIMSQIDDYLNESDDETENDGDDENSDKNDSDEENDGNIENRRKNILSNTNNLYSSFGRKLH